MMRFLFSLKPSWMTISAVLFCTTSFSSNATVNIESQLVERITKAKKTLANVEKQITYERVNLAKQLNKLEHQVVKLREKTAIARRLADEKTLSITKLEQRLATWEKQDIFQKNLLHRYTQQNNLPVSANGDNSEKNSKGVSNQLAIVIKHSQELLQQFYPQWTPKKVVMPNGEIVTNETLSLGPVTWYWDKHSQQAGLVSKENNAFNNTLQHDVYLQRGNELTQLRQTLTGVITFDPTLGQAITREQQSESLVEHVIKGGVWAVPILLFALFALVIALLKVVQLTRLPKFIHLTPSVLTSIVSNKADEEPSTLQIKNNLKGMQKALLDITTSNALSSQRDDLLFIKLQECKQVLDKRISAIAITAAISPLLGLLGTVSGMIETFKMMTIFGSGDPEVVSGGIAQALVTTELGLVVAIPALILNAVLSRKSKAYYADLENFAILISKSNEQVKEGVNA